MGLLTPLVLATLLRGRLRLMPTMALTVMEDSVLTATEVMVPDMALFLPLAHPLLLEPMPPQPPLPPSLFAATAMDMGTEDTPALSPLESRLSLLLASPSKDMLRDTATATVMVMAANHHICYGLTRLSNYQITTRIENQV